MSKLLGQLLVLGLKLSTVPAPGRIQIHKDILLFVMHRFIEGVANKYSDWRCFLVFFRRLCLTLQSWLQLIGFKIVDELNHIRRLDTVGGLVEAVLLRSTATRVLLHKSHHRRVVSL